MDAGGEEAELAAGKAAVTALGGLGGSFLFGSFSPLLSPPPPPPPPPPLFITKNTQARTTTSPAIATPAHLPLFLSSALWLMYNSLLWDTVLDPEYSLYSLFWQ